METIAQKDIRGYSAIHRAFESGSWTEIKKAVDNGASLSDLTASGATLKDFAEGLRLKPLYNKLEQYMANRPTHRQRV